MSINQIQAGAPSLAAARAAATPAQAVSTQIVSDAKLVRTFFAANFSPATRRAMVNNHIDGKTQPMLAAYDRMVRRSAANWSEKSGTVTINRSNITQAARNELAAFTRNAAAYLATVRREETGIFRSERANALKAIQAFEKSVREFKGGVTGYPSRAASERAIAAFGNNWKYTPHLKAETTKDKILMDRRLTIAMEPTINGPSMPNNPSWVLHSVKFRRPHGLYGPARGLVKPGTIQNIKVTFGHPSTGQIHSFYFSTFYPPTHTQTYDVTAPAIGNPQNFKFILEPNLLATMTWEGHVYISCCFRAGTMVTMGDGTRRAIETLVTGDVVLGRDGMRNTVLAPRPVPLGGRKMYGFNAGSAFVTAEHPFMLATGQWAAISREATLKEMPDFEQDYGPIRDLSAGDVIVREGGGTFVIETIDEHDAPEQTVYNMTLDGNRTYFADGFLVHNK